MNFAMPNSVNSTPTFQPQSMTPTPDESLQPDISMQPRYYFSDEVHNGEVQHIFAKCWNFVGFTEQVSEHGQFITADIANTSIVIQNFQGELRALHNVCTHRFALLQQEKCGKRALTCPYHGWTYDKDGVPFIPGNAKYFQLNNEARKARALQIFSLEVCGRFMFVRLTPQGPNLKEFLGKNTDLLQHLSDIFISPVDTQRSTWMANWKLGVESVLEVYHVDQVHPESFKHFVQPRWTINVSDDHNNGTAYLTENSAKWWAGVQQRLKLKASERFPHYDHFFIFPNLAIGLTQGCLMSVQTYTPTGPKTCELHYRIYMADSHLPADKQQAVRKAVCENVSTFNRIILREDQQIIEQVQKGHPQMNFAPIIGSNEARIDRFHIRWHEWMRAANDVIMHMSSRP